MKAGENKILSLIPLISKGLYEKEHVVALSVLAAVAGESIFLIGPPGTAKSMIARRMKYMFSAGRSFEYLMSRFSTPDEIFGPVSIDALKDRGEYKRLTSGYLPDSEIVFLDEIWKAGPAIQNSLLTVLNEKIFLNGNTPEKLPLKLLFAASNELPSESENLEAIWDRFLIRVVVEGITDRNLFENMISSYEDSDNPLIPEELLISDTDLRLWNEGIRCIQIPSEIFAFVHLFRSAVQSYNSNLHGKEASMLYISDRRWKKIMHLWRTSAFLNARSAIDITDVVIITDLIWNNPAQISDVRSILHDVLFQILSDIFGVELLKERVEAVRAAVGLNYHEAKQKEYKVVKSFFYQITGIRTTQQVLIYINEYDTLKADALTPCVMVYDRLKTGAQIIRKYDKNRFPSVFPKDLLQVRRTADGKIEINGCEYSLLETEQQPLLDNPIVAVSQENINMISSLALETSGLQLKVESYFVNADNLLRDNPFLSDVQRKIFKKVLMRVSETVKSLHYEVQEILHALDKGRI